MGKYLEGEDMKCPSCGHGLKKLDQGRYETLAEHVGNPNGEISLKDGYGCVNSTCLSAMNEVRWLFDGEGPYGGVYGKIPREEWFPPNTLHAEINKRFPSE